MSLHKPKVISLFAGCGGSSLGYGMAGCEVLAAVEFDSHAAKTYRANFPKTKFYEGDIAMLDPQTVLNDLGLAAGELDILDGSPPCQGFSTAGKRKVSDARNRLFEEYVRFLRAMKPKAFVMENVPGLVAGNMRTVFAEVITALRAEGYVVRARILNAAHYGVPQTRRRVIILGLREDLGLVPAHPAPKTRPVSLRKALEGLSGPGLTRIPTGHAMRIVKSLRPGESGVILHKRYRQKGNDFSIIRARWDKPAPTILKTVRVGQAGLFHPDEDRFLGINEVKRVCSFPDDFLLDGSFEDQWGRLGNAVPPLLAKAVAESLKAQLEVFVDG